jgi:membrane-associated phospholipid phosphatase
MVWPYYAYFALLVSAMWVEVRHRLWLYQGAAGAICVAATGFLLFYALPSQMEQPDLRAYADPAHRALQAMYDLDKGYHVFPSMHVALSVYTANFWRERMPRYWLGPGLVAFAVCASTVLCKRHYLLDLPAGLAVGLVMGRVGNIMGARLAKLCAFLR